MAANNAEWCDAVCRSHRLNTLVDDVAWTCTTRAPPYYPDAVTLVPAPSIPGLLARIDTSEGCSIKDSFASLDLHHHGFRVLFDAEWIARPATTSEPVPAGSPWDVVHEPDELTAWERAWRGGDGPEGLFRPELLADDAVVFLVSRTNGHVVGGAILNRSSTVVGISNFFTSSRETPTSWAGCMALADTLYPGATLVGYESGPMLAVARSQRFETVGPLRVWRRDA